MSSDAPLLTMSDRGLRCPAGGFWVDARSSVPVDVVTHAHLDHARRGCREYITAAAGAHLLRLRLGRSIRLRPLAWGERLRMGDVTISLHPAGHMLGSAQVRIERGGEVWVATGDFKRDADPTCEPFELVRCDTLVTESTFARPAFVWPEARAVFDDIVQWWEERRRVAGVAIVFAYAVGKAQRLLAEVGRRTDRSVTVHPKLVVLNDAYRRAGVYLPPTRNVPRKLGKRSLAGQLIIAPPRYAERTWYERFGDVETGVVTGWARGVEGASGEPLLATDRRFVISDHADWPALLRTIEESGARRVRTTHGDAAALVAHLEEKGIDAEEMRAGA